MKIAAVLFDNVTILDLVGPVEALSWLPDCEIVFVGPQRGPVQAAPTGLNMMIDAAFDEVSAADIVIVPGGPGVRPLAANPAAVEWIKNIHQTTKWTTSVCTGSLLLGAAGLLEGKEATTHWAAADALEKYGARYVEQRVVPQDKIVTSAGVSSGIDMALYLIGLIAGDEAAQAAQLVIEYDPQPPYDTGALSKAPAAVIDRARANLQSAMKRYL